MIILITIGFDPLTFWTNTVIKSREGESATYDVYHGSSGPFGCDYRSLPGEILANANETAA